MKHKLNILIIGSGGREHSLAWKIRQSSRLKNLYIAPGNGGTTPIAINVAINPRDTSKLVRFAHDSQIDLVVVGPDEALAAGLSDKLAQAGIACFGPTKKAAKLEWSKSFAKKVMQKAGIPTAASQVFGDYDSALGYLRKQRFPVVVKADGLALGKGVYICHNLGQAKSALDEIFIKRRFGAAGDTVIIEEFLSGQEISLHAFCDGKNFALFPTAQDHKPIFAGDKGPNTGGMGTVAPAAWMNSTPAQEIGTAIIARTLKQTNQQKTPFVGCLYPGIMVDEDGYRVLEFNARFGDPEIQSYLRLLKTDLLDIFEACAEGKLSALSIEWENLHACCIVVASGGYPGEYKSGLPITGLAEVSKLKDIVVFHAGTIMKDGKILTNGGRVLDITATGQTQAEALAKAYAAIEKLHFAGMQYRIDIGQRKIQPEILKKYKNSND